jgi:UDP-N-acetylmuramyl pentapeptide phosphotransferase/UDP-N-acetylglucosamine-1-phosphate transferase
MLGALLFALMTTPLVIAALRWVRLMDHPNERSSHTKATVRGAGWGVLFGTLAGWLTPELLGPLRWWLPVACVAYGLIGFVDDLRSLPASIRFGLQIAVSSASLVVAWGYDIIELPLVLLPVGVVLAVAYVNAFNFMDGVNAISGFQAAVAGGILAMGAIEADALDVQLGALAIAGAALGFLPYNAVRARCFLGDVGSYFIGSWIAMLCIVAIDRGVSLLTVGSVMAIYAADTAYTLVSRVRHDQKWWTPHREHVYQRLTGLGFSHVASASIVSAFTAAAGTVGLVAGEAGPTSFAVGVLAIVALCLVYLSLPVVLRGRSRDTNRPVSSSGAVNVLRPPNPR